MFKKFPFYTCWSRKYEEDILLNLNITKSNHKADVPKEFNITLEFHDNDTPLNCSGHQKNPIYHNIWTNSKSGFAL